MNASALEAILRRDRAIIIAALGVLTALAWFDLVWLAISPSLLRIRRDFSAFCCQIAVISADLKVID